jgi:hypothetical protein
MQFLTSIHEVLGALSLNDKTDIKDSAAFSSIIVSHVQAEPRVLPKLIPKLAEQVKISC